MTTQYLISNQTGTDLYVNNGTRYVLLPAFSVNTAILASNPDSLRIATTRNATTGTRLSTVSNYMMVQFSLDPASEYYACFEGVVTAISKTLRPHIDPITVTGTSIPSPGTPCTPAAGGAWNFDVVSGNTTLGFTDAPLITTPVGGEDAEAAAAAEAEAAAAAAAAAEAADEGWSTTTWVLIIGGVLLLLVVLIMIIYFATRKKKPVAIQVDAPATDPFLM